MILSFIEVSGEEYGDDKTGVREYRRKWTIVTDGRERPDDIKAHPLFAQRYEQYPSDPYARCVSRRVDQEKEFPSLHRRSVLYNGPVF